MQLHSHDSSWLQSPADSRIKGELVCFSVQGLGLRGLGVGGLGFRL